ncbi:right-handed parallel beta-helix repeat-containing protein [Alteromonas sp. KUL17]|uniref:glycosyl hydrolase family 28-related protein n=1 Tax=Alteromonas sp. KUL17 TaxID=2480796 RepID=UPI001F5E892B|nr:right-handed parallel beta-helix repeat-containing protein [Alteromonas sp. KUL17]
MNILLKPNFLDKEKASKMRTTKTTFKQLPLHHPLKYICLSLMFTSVHNSIIAAPELSIEDKLLSNDTYLPDYSYAGYHFGEREITYSETTTYVDVQDFGAVPNDNKDDTRAILNAFEHAHSINGHVTVTLPKGRFIVKDILKISRGNITVSGKGMGEQGTQLYFPMPLSIIDKTPHLDELRNYLRLHNKKQRDAEIYIDDYFSEYSWSGGVIWIQKEGTRPVPYLEELDEQLPMLATVTKGKRGTKTLEVSNTSQISVGDILRIDWHNKNGKQAGIIKSIYGDTDLMIGSHHYDFPDRPLVMQPTQVKSIRGNTVEIRDPLLHDINENIPAHLSSWEHLEEVGIEGLSIQFPSGETYGHHVEQGFNGIYLTSVFNSWIRDVSFDNADSAILTENSGNVTISNIHSYGTRFGHYGVHLGSVHNFLVEDAKISNPTVHTFSMNTKSTKSVFLRGEAFTQPTLDQHAGANHQNLYDNMTIHIETKRDEKGPYYDLWFGGGAGYWQPGHGRYNTTWNAKIFVESGADSNETVRILGQTEGPDARVVGIYGNRKFSIEHYPVPHISDINNKVAIPSLYDYQKQKRLAK